MIDKKSALSILATVALLAIAGCGGTSGGDSGTTAGPASTSAATSGPAVPAGSPAFVRAAWGICADANRQVATLTQVAPGKDTNRALDDVIAVRIKAQQRLGAVDVPSEAAADYRRFVARIGDQTAAFERIRDAAGARDAIANATAQAASADANAAQNRLARKLGIDGCAGG